MRGRHPRRGDARRDRLPHEYLWSEREVALLHRRWAEPQGIDVVGELAARLGRSRKAVRAKAASLGLPPRGGSQASPVPPHVRTEAIFSPDPIREIAARTGRSVSAIKQMRWRHRHAQP